MIDFSQAVDVIQEAASMEVEAAKAYLQSTDWHVIRQMETSQAIPVDVQVARTAARATINQLAPSPAS